MTIEKLIDYIDRIKPNNFDYGDMIRWINEVEGKIQTEIYLLDIHDIVQYDWDDNWTGAEKSAMLSTELIVPAPYDKIYTTYLLAEVDNANGEYNRYGNTKLQFDKAFADYSRYVAQIYSPGNRPLKNRIHGREAIVDARYYDPWRGR